MKPRNTPRKPKRWRYPLGIERDYRRAMDAYVNSITEAIEQTLPKVLPQLREDDLDDMPPTSGWLEGLRVWLLGVSETIDSDTVIVKMKRALRQTDRFNRRQFHGMLRSAYEVDVLAAEPYLEKTLIQFEAENIRLIKSIPKDYLERLHGRIVASVRKGTHPRELAQEIRQTYGIPKVRARLIARDQIGKLNGQLNRQRLESIGVTHYRWRGALDARERPEHVAREGQTYAFKNPPWDGNPGEPIQCRCHAEGILPLLEDITGVIAQ